MFRQFEKMSINVAVPVYPVGNVREIFTLGISDYGSPGHRDRAGNERDAEAIQTTFRNQFNFKVRFENDFIIT